MRFKRFGTFGAVVAACGLSSAVQAATLPEVQVTSSEIIDPEYDQDFARFAFSDNDCRLWIGNIDRATGNFVPSNGHAILVDVNAAPPIAFTNGPEWMFSQLGHQLVYTRYAPNRPHTDANAGTAVASEVNGKWSGDFLQVGLRMPTHIPAGTLDDSDPIPRISFNGPTGLSFYWQLSNDPSSEEPVPMSDQGDGTRRWVKGMHAMTFTATVTNADGTQQGQFFIYNTDTKTLEQLTHDAGSKAGGFMWRAPEFNNDYVFFTTVDLTRIQVYRKLPDSSGHLAWTVIDTINTPAELPYVFSPEPFVHNGRSYVFLDVATGQTNAQSYIRYPSQIAITGILASHPDFHLLTNDSSTKLVRTDPEVFVTDQGPFIYYNRYTMPTSTTPTQSQGIWRVDTGLGPVVSGAKKKLD